MWRGAGISAAVTAIFVAAVCACSWNWGNPLAQTRPIVSVHLQALHGKSPSCLDGSAGPVLEAGRCQRTNCGPHSPGRICLQLLTARPHHGRARLQINHVAATLAVQMQKHEARGAMMIPPPPQDQSLGQFIDRVSKDVLKHPRIPAKLAPAHSIAHSMGHKAQKERFWNRAVCKFRNTDLPSRLAGRFG